MNKLAKIQAQFENRNKAGNAINILAYHPGQEYPLIVEVNYGGGWSAGSFSEDGTVPGGEPLSCNLIKKRHHLPKDILCEVWDSPALKYKRYSSGDGKFLRDGVTSLIGSVNLISWDNHRVIENEPKPWFGGKCPIPEGCEFMVRINGKWLQGDGRESARDWADGDDYITAYQILGEKDE